MLLAGNRVMSTYSTRMKGTIVGSGWIRGYRLGAEGESIPTNEAHPVYLVLLDESVSTTTGRMGCIRVVTIRAEQAIHLKGEEHADQVG